jgi:ABC-2 type transport system permease protein
MTAAARIMLLSILRDRAGLLMGFVLPPIVFVIFAAIFASATGSELRLHVGLVDVARTESSRRLAGALATEPSIRLTVPTVESVAMLRALVRGGVVDVGVAIVADLETRPGEGPAPVLLIEDAARSLATPIVVGHVQKTINERLPDVALGRILADIEAAGAVTKEERAFLDQAFRTQVADRKEAGFSFAALFSRETATGMGVAGGPVAYYAGAITVVFLLFAAMQGGATLVEERQSGIFERLLVTPGGMAAAVTGKFLFLVAQGILQAGLIFAVASLLYGVDVGPAWLRWLTSCTSVSVMAAGLSLGLAASCSTRHQVQMLSTFGVLLLSAVGGSMVPRFLMPQWLQEIGWVTPNAWAIEAFQAALRPGSPEANLLLSWGVLAGVGLVGLLLAIALTLRRPAIDS